MRENLFTVDEIAAKYKISASVIKKWIRQGVIKHAEKLGKGPRSQWLISGADLESSLFLDKVNATHLNRRLSSLILRGA